MRQPRHSDRPVSRLKVAFGRRFMHRLARMSSGGPGKEYGSGYVARIIHVVDSEPGGGQLRALQGWARLNPDVITRNSPAREPATGDAAPVSSESLKRPRSIFPGTGAVHFSTRGEYGTRLMVELARHHGGGPISLAEMAEHEALPRPYLEQLVVSLREAGLVTSTRGARGGYELGRPPAEIRMGEVLRALEGPLAPMVCASEDPAHAAICERTGFCNVNDLWLTVRNAISVALDSITLADLAVPRARHPHHSQPIQVAPAAAHLTES